MKISKFEKHLKELCGDDTIAQYSYLNKFKKYVFDAYEDEDNKWKLFHIDNIVRNNIKSGVYLNICCGLNGIYQTYNIWNNKTFEWEIKSADGGYVIMYKDIESYLV